MADHIIQVTGTITVSDDEADPGHTSGLSNDKFEELTREFSGQLDDIEFSYLTPADRGGPRTFSGVDASDSVAQPKPSRRKPLISEGGL